MFIYLIKKIAIPNGIKLHSLAWNPDQGWIACGGDQGLLKVLKLDSLSGGKDAKTKGVAAASNLSMNQSPEGHNGSVMCVTWNTPYRKLTTSDQNGLIIVWMLHKGIWLEEMINNRNKSIVRDMKWTADGQKICIVYEDGAVIVGSVDGNRLWGKELDTSLRFVEWSPDARNIIFITKEGEAVLFDAVGNKVKNLRLPILDNMTNAERADAKIIGIHWYDGAEGSIDPNAPSLAVAYDVGKLRLSRSPEDDKPIILDTKMKLTQCKWNTTGTILAVAGSLPSGSAPDGRDLSMVNFYDAYGTFIRNLKVPGSGITALSWEGTGLRIALAVEAFIFFANIRADYKWAYLNKTLVYAYNKPERPDTSVVFWDISTDTRYIKHFKNVKAIRAAGDSVLIVLATGERSTSLVLCNAIGVPVDVKDVPLSALFVAMTPLHVIVASERTVYLWQYRTTQAAKLAGGDTAGSASLRKPSGREKIFDIDDRSPTPAQSVENCRPSDEPTRDPISAVTASDKSLMVGRESGVIQQYLLPHISLEGKRTVVGTPLMLSLNCNSSRLAVVDVQGILTIQDLNNTMDGEGKVDDSFNNNAGPYTTAFERKDVWDLKWAEDNPDALAVMEKTRLYVYVYDQGQAGGAPTESTSPPQQPTAEGEAVQSSGYLGTFKNLEVRTLLLDEVLANADSPDKDAAILDIETKVLKDTRDLITHSGLEEAFRFVDGRRHPRLWQLLAESALEALDFNTADKAFVRCGDYQGIQCVKRLRVLGDRMKQRAEVAVYFGRVDEAEAIYREIDRKDLAIQLRERLGDWSRVVQLLQNGGGDDQMLFQAWNRIGDHYAEKFKWSKAAQYYLQAKNYEKVASCYYRMEDYDSLEKLVELVPYGGRDFLLELGNMLQTVGMVEPAVECFVKAGDPKLAIDCCVLLNHWTKAVELAEQHNFPQIEGLLTKQIHRYLEKGDQLKAIELFRRANRATDAAQLLASMAEDIGKKQVNPLRAKKLHVLAAFEVERFRKNVLDVNILTTGTGNRTVAQTTAQTLDNLMTVDRESGKSRVLDNAWRGAAAYHYYLLAHRQLYAGNVDAAMKTSIRLAEFEDILSAKDIYSLIALTSFHNRYYGVCSRAFIKLETLPHSDNNDDYPDLIQTLAVKIFTQYPPYDPATISQEYIRCLETGTPYQACTVTGRSVQDARTYLCRTCRHFAIETELRAMTNCPLCHSPLL